jgi:hypothetical protein
VFLAKVVLDDGRGGGPLWRFDLVLALNSGEWFYKDRCVRTEVSLGKEVMTVPVNLNRREAATVVAALHLLAGNGVRVPNYPRTLVAGLACDVESDFELRYEADEDYVRELIDRIDEMALRGAQLCRRCAEQYPGRWQAKSGSAQCADCDRTITRYFVMGKAAAVARRTSRGLR